MSAVEMALHVVAFIVGFALFCTTIAAVINSMLSTRPTRSRLSHLAVTASTRMFRAVAMRRDTFEKRDALLAVGAPVSLLIQLLVFVVVFLIALGLMILGTSELGFWSSMYQSGATLLTLGIMLPVNPPQVVITFVSAFCGLAVIAILIGYLLTLNSAYAPRESKLAKLSLLAGEPAWGPEIICRASLLADNGWDEFNPAQWLDWVTDIRLSQSTNSILNHYRSQSPYRSWVIGLLALLDAANLGLTTVRSTAHRSTLAQLIAEGTQTLAVLHFNHEVRTGRAKKHSHGSASTPPGGGTSAVGKAIALDASRALGTTPIPPASLGQKNGSAGGIDRAQWDQACSLMATAGATLVDDLDTAWSDFSNRRSLYIGFAEALAQELYVVAAPWSGPRHPDTKVIWPALSAQIDTGKSSNGGGGA